MHTKFSVIGFPNHDPLSHNLREKGMGRCGLWGGGGVTHEQYKYREGESGLF